MKLFFDDGSLALVVLVILAVSFIVMNGAGLEEPAAMVTLAGGVAIALVENVVRTARTSRLED